MTDATPRIAQAPAPQGPQAVRLLGEWTAAQFARPGLLRELVQALPEPSAEQGWDLQPAQRLDHVGAQLLWDHWGRRWPAQLALEPAQRAVLERVAQFTTDRERSTRPSWWSLYLEFGAALLRGLGHVKGFLQLIGNLMLDLLQLLRAPNEGPWRDFSGQLYRIGATALPITALVGSLIGVVLAYLTAQQLRQLGADAFIVDILGVALVRELGPMLAAILIAGRSGSAITAEIGVMRVTDELDAMRVMGISHSFRLVMPRAMALAIAMPLISAWTTVAGLIGGMVAADLSLGVGPSFFINALPQAVHVHNLLLGTAKSVVFGVLIALIGCHYGLRVQPNTQSLGAGTTASVVTAITAVILVDALFAIVFSNVGI
ncbi:MAG: putative transporter, permease component [Ramlibacter sp.]|jgi:phospholipid/cholesterol/gamma-HCH transport system permease protein|uniref:MlaE family ABC transporter permease n=1 Tax=Ramlibacter sp. TaxID=1917967 RepID=UPI002608D7A7|nr:ABC transporter permease [Ramlibacter sp.]MDB5750074.1 putative transporter, permease component [Ramlibacter sp.]